MDNVHTKCTMYKVVCRKDANYVVTDWLRVWWLRESNFFSLFGCPGSALQMKAMERSSMTAVLDDLFGILMHRFKWMSCREGNFLLMLCSADFITLCRSPWSPKEQLPYQAVMQPLRMFSMVQRCEEVQMLPGCSHHCVNVCGPFEVVGNVDGKEFKTAS